ncbi:MAG TPA: hypothetical protein PLM79_07790 [Syntrophobacteraceae bacterium]|nr:hypothetical protein [Syntrophobacteraceae bacterium]
MARPEFIEAFEERLWSAEDTLRANSNYAGNENFLPVMGLAFLRISSATGLFPASCGSSIAPSRKRTATRC